MISDIKLWMLSPLMVTVLCWHLPVKAESILTDPLDNEAGEVSIPLAQDSQSDPSEPGSLRILVTGDNDNNNYYVPETSTGIIPSMLENPQSVQVIPRQVLEDQQVLDLDEALRNIGGASVSSTEGRGFQVNLRGFEGVPVFRDGFRLYSPNGNGDAAGQNFPEIANIERIEVLRGPASALFGQIDPGGAVNVVTKKPLETPFAEVALQVGSDGLLRPRIDVSGPLSENGNLLYRLNAVYLSEDGFRDFDQDIERFFVSPSLTWKISDRTDLNLQLEYLDDQRPLDTGLVAFGDGLADIPQDRVLGELDDEISSEYFSAGYTLEHRFSDNWQLRNAFRYIRNADDISAALSFPFIGGLDEATGTLNRVFGEQEVVNTTYALQTNAVGEFSTGPIDHRLLLGLDLARYELKSESFTDFSLRIPINIFNPVYGAVARPERSDEILSGDGIDTDSLRIYVQDQMQITDDLSLVAGISYETTEQTTTDLIDEAESELNEDAFTPLIGLVYQPLDNLSLYANYSQSFLPNSAVTIAGDPLEPEEGEGFEVGVKAELLDQRLLATLAYFNLTKQNVATADPTNPRFSVATGEQQSEGIELDIIGEILPGWNIIGSYAYIDAEVTEDNRVEPGNRLPGVPEHSASVWTTYKIQSGDLAGLGFGLGFNWVDKRQGDLDNSFDLDSYFLTNAAISYGRDNWQFALNFRNLFDVDFVTGAPRTRTRGIEPGEPFTVVGSFSYRF